jgi:succinoglycan biosynthesis transport protein ExoP
MHTPHVIPTTGAPAPPPLPAARPAAAPPRPPAAAKPGAKADEGGGLRVLTYLRLHWLTILFCGALLGGAGAYAAWELLASKYESYALLQVSSAPPTVGSGGNREQARTDFVTYLKTTSALIKSEFVLTAALREIKDLPTIKAQPDPIKYLDEELVVTWQDGSEVIRIVFKSHEPADAKKIVDAVQNAFMKEVVQKDIQEKQTFLKKVDDAKVEMRRIIDLMSGPGREKSDAAKGPTTPDHATPAGAGMVPEIPNAMPAPGPLPPVAPAGPVAPAAPPAPGGLVGTNPEMPRLVPGWEQLGRMDPRIVVNRMSGLIQKLEQLPLAMNDNKRRLVLLKQQLDDIKNAPVSQITLDMVEKDQDVIVQILKTKQAQREYEFRLNAAGGDTTAPGIVRLKEAWDAHEAKLTELRKEKAETIERFQRLGGANKIAVEMNALIRKLQEQQEQFDFAKASLVAAEKQLAELPAPDKGGVVRIDGREVVYDPAASVTDSIDGVYRRLVSQYYLTQMELNSPPRVRPLQAGSNPTQKDMKKQIMGTIFAGLLGFGLIGFGVVAFETVSKRVSSLADVRSATQTPVVGVIPYLPADATGKDPVKRVAASEAIDKLRTYVAQAWLARGASTVAVTSPIGEEGKAFAAFGLASSLAQNGYKTLLVDFDLRDPQLHEFAGVPNGTGVCELLRAETDPRTALQCLPSGLHLLTAGKWSDEARKAVTGEKLEALLGKLRGPYDCVVLHGHALLTAAESVEVARRCEVVLVCALYRTTTTPLLKRTTERVAAMEIPYSGVVYVGATEQEAMC